MQHENSSRLLWTVVMILCNCEIVWVCMEAKCHGFGSWEKGKLKRSIIWYFCSFLFISSKTLWWVAVNELFNKTTFPFIELIKFNKFSLFFRKVNWLQGDYDLCVIIIKQWFCVIWRGWLCDKFCYLVVLQWWKVLNSLFLLKYVTNDISEVCLFCLSVFVCCKLRGLCLWKKDIKVWGKKWD